jgi:hypothetical protein
VRNNPGRWFDRRGLTEQDIQNMLDLAAVNNPDLNVPGSVFVDNLGMAFNGMPIGGLVDPITSSIWISDDYLRSLSCAELQRLYELIVHESIHRTKPLWDMISRPVNHPDIYDDARKRRSDALSNIVTYCKLGCGK